MPYYSRTMFEKGLGNLYVEWDIAITGTLLVFKNVFKTEISNRLRKLIPLESLLIYPT